MNSKTLFEQYKEIEANTLFTYTINQLDLYVFVLNEDLKIVYINKTLLDTLKLDLFLCIGSRIGDILKCQYSVDRNKGCGENEICEHCPVRNIAVEAVMKNHIIEGPVDFLTIFNDIEESYNYTQKTSPIEINNHRYYMTALKDRSESVLKENLERVFFHDVLNSASSIKSLFMLYKEDKEDVEIESLIEESISKLINDINYQRNILNAESGQGLLTMEEFRLDMMINKTIMSILSKDRFKSIGITTNLEPISIISNEMTLNRVLMNIIINACEANIKPNEIKISLYEDETFVHIEVFNKEEIPLSVKRNLFGLGNTTKGIGRGIGLYGAKLLLETMLSGSISFDSINGTNFTIKLKK